MAGRWTAAEAEKRRLSVISMCERDIAHTLVAEAHGIHRSRVSRILERWAPHLRVRVKAVDPVRIAELAGRGLSNEAIAADLKCSPRTVEMHRRGWRETKAEAKP